MLAGILQLYSIGKLTVIRLISVTEIGSEEMSEEEKKNREHFTPDGDELGEGGKHSSGAENEVGRVLRQDGGWWS